MRVILNADLFAAGTTEQLHLLTIFGFGFSGRHHVQTDPISSPQLSDWLQNLTPQTRAECELALEAGVRDHVHSPSDREIRVAAVASPEWSSPQPVLPLSYAVEFLQQPFFILFEDNLSDRDFLLAVASQEIRDKLQRMVQKSWMIFEHGGGTGGMKMRIRERASIVARQLRTWALFDSDALRPNQPGRGVVELEHECGTTIPFHRLQRRAIENYLPVQAIDGWALGSGERSKKANAFRKLSTEQRFHFNMKEGFAGDLHRIAEAGDLFAGLDVHTINALQQGIHRNIANLFDPMHYPSPDPARSPLPDWWLEIDGQTIETKPMLERLMELL
jgi:hypothetical protein